MTTAELLSHLMAINLAASVAVILVLALRHPVRRFVGARTAYWLWLVVPIAMLASTAPAPPAIGHAITAPIQPAATATIEWVTVTAEPAAHVTRGFDLSLLVLVWLSGAAGFAAYLLVGQHRAVERLGLLGRDADGFTRAASREAGPALIGLFRPRIVLPTDFERRFHRREQELILAHERTHLAQGHLWINGFTALIRTLNWFNPLVHLGAHHALVDQELACDAAVVERFPGERRTYAEALLKSQQARIPLPLGCTWPGRSPQLLQERLVMLNHTKPTHVRLMVGGAFVGALCLTTGAAAWATTANVGATRPVVVAQAAAAPARPAAATAARPVQLAQLTTPPSTSGGESGGQGSFGAGRSDGYTEVGSMKAYPGEASGVTDIFIYPLPNGQGDPITVSLRAGESRRIGSGDRVRIVSLSARDGGGVTATVDGPGAGHWSYPMDANGNRASAGTSSPDIAARQGGSFGIASPAGQ